MALRCLWLNSQALTTLVIVLHIHERRCERRLHMVVWAKVWKARRTGARRVFGADGRLVWEG